MFFKFSISSWNSSKLENSLKALCNSVKIKVYLYQLGIKLLKLINTPENGGLQQTEVVSLLFLVTVLMSWKDNELFISISDVNLILACQRLR